MTAVQREVCGRRLVASAARRIGPVCERRTRAPRPSATGTHAGPPVDHAAAEAAGQLTITEEDQDADH